MKDNSPSGVTVHAPAKINVVLDILGHRPDGFHELRSLVTPLSLCDTLEISSVKEGITAQVRPVALPNRAEALAIGTPSNLAVRAAEHFFALTGLGGGCRITIHKRIPVGAGLGGGSADAAGTLLGLNTLFSEPLCPDELLRAGSVLGCDVPSLLWGGPVWVAGRGELVEPVKAPLEGMKRPFWLVLLNPGFTVATADIYRRWIPGLTLAAKDYKKTESVFMSGDVVGLADCLWNGLQQTAFTKYPVLEVLADALLKAGALAALMAGSGGTVYGLARSKADAIRIRRKVMADVDASVWSRVVKTMPDGVMVAHGPLEARV